MAAAPTPFPVPRLAVPILGPDPDEDDPTARPAYRIEAFLDSRNRWSAHHRRNAASILGRFAAHVTAREGHDDLAMMTVDAVQSYFTARLDAGISPTTMHKEHQVLGWFYAWMNRCGWLPWDERRSRGGATFEIPPDPLGPLSRIDIPAELPPDPHRIRRISEADYYRLLATFDRRRANDRRDAAVCSLLYWSGLRRSEAARARRADYEAGVGADGAVLLVLGKGGRWRTVIVLDETRRLINSYLTRRGPDDNPALFASTRPGGGHLEPGSITQMLERRAAKVGLRIAAHQFRRAATSEAKARGVAETEIARNLGWTPQSAKILLPRYLSPDADKLTEAAWRATDPTRRRGV